MPPAKIITNSTSISARCFSAKAMSAFMTILTGVRGLELEHDLFRKPVSSPDQVRAKLFRDHPLAPDRCAVDEQTALGDDPLAGPQALEHLDHSALGDADLDRPQLDHPLLV